MDENKEINLDGPTVTPTPVETPVETVIPSAPVEPVITSVEPAATPAEPAVAPIPTVVEPAPTLEPTVPKKERNKAVTIAIVVLVLAVAAVLGYFGGRMLYEKVNGPIATE